MAAVSRRRAPRYRSDVRAIEDFTVVHVVHWAYYIDYPLAENLSVAPVSADIPDDDWLYTNLVPAC
jgi:hypothetical protein